jgi:hypothetical protein
MFSHLAEILLIEAKMELPMLVNEAKKEVPKHLDGLITDEMRKSFKDKFFPTKTSKLDPKTLEKVTTGMGRHADGQLLRRRPKVGAVGVGGLQESSPKQPSA